MRIQPVLASILMLALPGAVPAHASNLPGDVSIEIVTDNGRVLPVHALQSRTGNRYRAYLEAVYGKNYGIRVQNRSGRRIGLVIAVDGRNIISGRKSHLKSSEQMYILGPYERGRFDGWRTSTEKVHRFFFTDAGDSYAGAWNDYSAMGVIAVAVFPEKARYLPAPAQRPQRQRGDRRREGASHRAPAAAQEKSAAVLADVMEPGTGFGEEQASHVRLVHFDPVATASSRYYFKYEWRETLCNKGIIDCGTHRPNRFWPHDIEFAPFPPG